jgi:hypothetical protein
VIREVWTRLSGRWRVLIVAVLKQVVTLVSSDNQTFKVKKGVLMEHSGMLSTLFEGEKKW